MKMVQVQFARKIGGWKTRHTTAWVDQSWRLKPGQFVTFTDDARLLHDRRWKVVRVGTIVQEYQEINNTWRVGGL
jgi:hypothetical protein